MLPSINDVKKIYLLNSDEVLGIPSIWIVFELNNQSKKIYATKKEQKQVIEWFEVNLPKLTSVLKQYLSTKPFEEFLIADIYQRLDS